MQLRKKTWKQSCFNLSRDGLSTALCLGLTIFITLCCCSPFGLIAIYKASRVNDYYILRQYNSAIMASNAAKTLLTIGATLLSLFLWLVVMFDFLSKLNNIMDSMTGLWESI